MKKGMAQYPMFVYGLIILVVVLLISVMLFTIDVGDFTETKSFDYSNLDITLLNYLRTPVKIDNLDFTMDDLIVYNYHKDDFSELEKEADKFLEFYYGERCTVDIAYFVDGDKVESFLRVKDFDIGNDPVIAEASVLSLDGKVIDVRVVETC